MKILLTNDDGINAEGLKTLSEWAKAKGEVHIFAPKNEQSGKSHSIDIHRPYECKKNSNYPDIEAYSVDSTPADCVRVAILAMKNKYDLVISGINRGFNVGGDICYSGTVGACFEAAKLGQKCMAISTHWDGFEQVRSQLDRIYEFICQNKMFDHTDIINVNVPAEGEKFLITRQGPPIYGDEFQIENDIVKPKLISLYQRTADLTLDTDATMTGHISITPLQIDSTNMRAYQTLQNISSLKHI